MMKFKSFAGYFLRLYRFMSLYLTQRLIYPLHNKLINRVAVGLKLYVAFLSVEWELFKVHLTRNIKIDCFRVSDFAVIIDSETRILQYNISKIFTFYLSEDGSKMYDGSLILIV